MPTKVYILTVILIGSFLLILGFASSKRKSSNFPSGYSNISASELKSILSSGKKDVYLLDVHIPEQKHIEGTDAFIPYNKIGDYKTKLPKRKDMEIVVYCRSGSMSKMASEELARMGYTNVKNLIGGINEWNKL